LRASVFVRGAALSWSLAWSAAMLCNRLLSTLRVRHPRVGGGFCPDKPGMLPCPGDVNAFANFRRRLTGFFRSQLSNGKRRRLNVQIDPVE
jgi:hypothetical protein